jgi:hypothetical protein
MTRLHQQKNTKKLSVVKITTLGLFLSTALPHFSTLADNDCRGNQQCRTKNSASIGNTTEVKVQTEEIYGGYAEPNDDIKGTGICNFDKSSHNTTIVQLVTQSGVSYQRSKACKNAGTCAVFVTKSRLGKRVKATVTCYSDNKQEISARVQITRK